MEIKYSKSAAKYLDSLDQPTQRRIHTAIIGLTEEPPKGDVKLLANFMDGRKRLRVGKYRIVFRYDKEGKVEILYIIDIDSRGGIYKRRRG